jgi:hypothetical protein
METSTKAAHTNCELAPSVLPMMGLQDVDPCPFCRRECSVHLEPEYDDSLSPEVEAPPAATYSQPVNSNGEKTTSKPSRFSGGELASLITIWIFSIALWVHLFFFIPHCETEKDLIAMGQGGICRYYGHQVLTRTPTPEGVLQTYRFKYNWYFWFVFGFTVLAYVIQCCVAPERQYLSHLLPNGIEAYIRGLVLQRPSLWFRIECYHYETRTVRTKKGTKSKRKKVTTHRAESTYTFEHWRDVSSSALGPLHAPVKRLRSWQRFVFADARTKASYDQARDAFVHQNDRDAHNDVTTGMKLENFHDFTLSYRVRPPYFSMTAYVLLSVFTLSVFFRHYFYAMTEPVDFHCVKEIGGHGERGSGAPPPYHGVTSLHQQWNDPPPPYVPLEKHAAPMTQPQLHRRSVREPNPL